MNISSGNQLSTNTISTNDETIPVLKRKGEVGVAENFFRNLKTHIARPKRGEIKSNKNLNVQIDNTKKIRWKITIMTHFSAQIRSLQAKGISRLRPPTRFHPSYSIQFLRLLA